MGNCALGCWFGLLVTSLVLSACSGDGGEGPSCGTFGACGGNIVGIWEWQASCGAVSPSASACESTLNTDSLIATSSVTFSGDGTLTATTVTAEVDYSVTYTAACYSTVMGQPMTDADVAQMCSNVSGGATTGTISCALEGTACVCSLHMPAQTRTMTSTYTTSGNTITTTNADGEVDTSSYCVSGSSLTVSGDLADAYAIFEKH